MPINETWLGDKKSPQAKPPRFFRIPLLLLLAFGVGSQALTCLGQQPRPLRRVPAPGISVPAKVRLHLSDKLVQLENLIAHIEDASLPASIVEAHLPDVAIFHKAVDYALHHNEFYKTNEFTIASDLLEQGMERGRSLLAGHAPWIEKEGLVVRGYRSRIDNSIQPYGLVIPKGNNQHQGPQRLDIWFHGRDNQLTELKFLHQRQNSEGPFTPADTIVLHPYGRYCNAFKFAGEVDVFEALKEVQETYRVDPHRIAVRGFSMGGAGCWHFAVHHASRWAAAAPGAGFAETPDYLNIPSRSIQPPWYEKALWGWYNATDYALNLSQCQTLAYSGEDDKQIQAAHMMAEALSQHQLTLDHEIGPKTGHKYHPDSKARIATKIDATVAAGRNPNPSEVVIETKTLRYNVMNWVEILGLEQHWSEAPSTLSALVEGNQLSVESEGVSSFKLNLRPFQSIERITLNGQPFTIRPSSTHPSSFHKTPSGWKPGLPETHEPRKKPGLQGPIDDAFMDAFLYVAPSDQGFSPNADAWVRREMENSARQWRRQFRGVVQAKDAASISTSDIANHNLILWGDPSSNPLIQKVLEELPLTWTPDALTLGEQTVSARTFMPRLIYPNPLNPKRYVVINSGFTFYNPISSSNADQTPKLPDFAIVDIQRSELSDIQSGIVQAGFFNESWQLESPTR